MELILRIYQLLAVDRLRQSIARGNRKLILQLETGGGKTCVAIHMIICALAKSKSCLFLSRGRKIVGQTSEKLWDYSVRHTVLMSGEEYDPANVIVASKDTLASWVKYGKIQYPRVDLVFVDECHESLSKEFLKIIRHYEEAGAVIIGLTATPARKGGMGLGDFYLDLVQVATTTELIKDGFLVPTRVFAPYRPQLKGIKASGGDYNEKQIEKLMDQMKLTGDVIQHWKELGENRPTLCFCVTVAHSIHVCEQFNAAGITARHMDADTEDDERKEILRQLCDGEIKVVTSVGVLNQGVDLPPVSCAINLRPTKSLVFWRQMIGRIRRPFPGKEWALLIDHAGAVYMHGLPDSDIIWKLDKGEKVQDRMKKHREKEAGEPIHCPKCHAIFTKTNQCPNCGFVLKKLGKSMEHSNGKLVQLNAVDANSYSEDVVRVWNRCRAFAVNRGRKGGAAAGMFKSSMGKPPWEFKFLPDMPNWQEWKMPAVDLWPGFAKRKKVSA